MWWLPDAFAAEHLVRQGDSLQSIARAWGTDVATVQRLNHIRGADLPPVGATVLVPDRPGSASVPAALSSVVGAVRATDPAGQPISARIGAVLPVGSTLCTEADSYATVRLAATRGGTHDDVSLSPDSCVQVRTSIAAPAGRQSRLRLTDGSLSVRAAEAPGEVVVDTPSGLATGAGGGFRVHLEDERTRLESLDAAVALIGAGKEQVVDPGFGARVAAGRAPDRPSPLPAASEAVLPDDGSALLDPVFAWTPVERVLGYRVEFSSAPDFTEVVFSEDVSTPGYTPEVLFLPIRVRGLWWRIASFDRAGFLGPPSRPRALTLPAPTPPAPLTAPR
jgi:hypothetical protein